MLIKLLLYVLIPKLTLTQLNGDFWWLNDQVKKLKGVQPPSPNFEVLSEFDNDESSKIVFRDDDTFSMMGTSEKSDIEEKDINLISEQSESAKIVWPNNFVSVIPYEETSKRGFIDDFTEIESLPLKQNNENENNDLLVFHYPGKDNRMTTKSLESNQKEKSKSIHTKEEKTEPESENDSQVEDNTSKETKNHPSFQEDVVVFQFPVERNNNRINVTVYTISKINTDITKNQNERNVKVSPHQGNQNATEKICTYLKKTKCFERNGLILKAKSTETTKFIETFLVCCVLPLSTEERHKIVFPDFPERSFKRSKRSNTDSFTPLNQREFLLRSKSTQNAKTAFTKIVTPDDDFLDPYWNIKSSNFKKPNKPVSQKQEYGYQDYVEDYVEELPRPGLGLYSDNEYKPPSWTYGNDNPNPSYDGSIDDGDEDYGTSFGYSTIDPRRVSTSKLPKRGRPVKVSTEPPEEELPFDIESQTISFQSNPNFQVLQGFKLLNLARSKNKFYSKNTRRSTTESSIENDSSEHFHIESDTLEGHDGEKQLFRHCGETSVILHESRTRAKDIGEAEEGSHPWLAIVVPSKRPQNILCYATIVHPRAAVTAGDCVSDYSKVTAKDVVVVVIGLQEIKERSQTQSRIGTVQLHPQWRRENLAHNLAILHWKRPIRLNTNVQPACLASSHEEGDCKFYGWGGFDQAMRQRARWQKASVVSPQQCTTYFSKAMKLPSDVFCATVRSRGTVTGLGGTLTCHINGRATSFGVAVYRDTALVLIPAREWILRAMADLNIE